MKIKKNSHSSAKNYKVCSYIDNLATFERSNDMSLVFNFKE